jgi:hypothetical protein
MTDNGSGNSPNNSSSSNHSSNHNGSNGNGSDGLIRKILEQYGLPGLFYGLAIQNGIDSFEEHWRQVLLFFILGTFALALLSEVTKDIFQPIVRRILRSLVAKSEQGFIWLTSSFQRKYYTHLTTTYQKYRTQRFDVQVAVSLGLEKMFVPLGVLPEAYDQISPRLIQVSQDATNRTIWDYLAASVKHFPYRRIALIAPPGAGKTTILEHITLTYAQNTQHRQNRHAPRLIPFLLHLRDIRHEIQGDRPDLATLIGNQSEIQRYEPPNRWIQKKLEQGECLVMLDGLDEVPDEGERQQVSRWIDQQIRTYSQTRFIITSRPLSYQNAGLEKIDAYLRVAPFGSSEIRQFLYNWYLQEAIAGSADLGKKRIDKQIRRTAEAKTDNLIERIETGGSSPLSELAFNPLLLTMIATVHDNRQDLPLGRVQLYAEIYKVLLVKRYQDRKIYDADVIWKTKQVLQSFALEMMHQGSSSVHLSGASPDLHHQLGEILQGCSSLEDLLKQTDSASGLLVNIGDETYTFTHQSFQEYLAAVHIEETSNQQLLLNHLDNEWWSETIHLHASQFGNATPIVEEAIRRNTLVPLTVANGLIQDDVPIEAEVQQQLEATLTQGLRDSDPEIFKLAAEVTLVNRLKRLKSLNSVTAIDQGYITQSEYQLFLDAQQRLGNFHYPDHWTQNRFQVDDAQEPIVGIRAEDARAFCEWLGHSRKSADPGVTYRYRVPTVSENQANPMDSDSAPASNVMRNVMPWCVFNGRDVLDTEPEPLWNHWQEQLMEVLPAAMEGDRQTACQVAKNPNLALLNHLPNESSETILNPTFDLRQAIALANDPHFNQAVKLVNSRALRHYTNLAELKALVRAIQLLRNQLPGSRRLLERQNLNAVSLEMYRAYVLGVASLWHELAIAYNSIVEYRQSLRWLPTFLARMSSMTQQKTVQDCQVQGDRLITVYAFFVLLDERKAGRFPAWEGIRIIREKIQH